MASFPSHCQAYCHRNRVCVWNQLNFRKTSFVCVPAQAPTLRVLPFVNQLSQTIHSRYWRMLQDLPAQCRAVELRVEVRRFRCRNQNCMRKTFVEQVPSVTAKNSQQTSRCSETVRLLGYTLGGEGGCRLAKRLASRTSPDTVLRKVKQKRVEDQDCPKFLGVDDWAWRKAQRYGTILVDLETRRPIDLLWDRSADCFAAWFKQHPTVQLISRDRAETYADGATRGAPEAIQVADRFHLLCYLTSAIERVLETKRSELSKASEADELKVEQSAPIETSTKMSGAEGRSKQCR